MQIRGRPIGPAHPPYVIAEVSCNHAGSEAVAHALIQVAKDAGAEAVKFQFYTPEGMVGAKYGTWTYTCGDDESAEEIGEEVRIDKRIRGGPWSGQSMYELYDSARMPFEWGPRLKQRCHDLGLAFIASAYEVDGLNWLEANCQPDAYKVASFEATDTPFVKAVRGTGIPTIISCGMGYSPFDWREAAPRTTRNVVYLHCVSAYPTAAKDADVSRVSEMGCQCCDHWGEYGDCGSHPQPDAIGFSDHTLGHAVACAAVARGACVLEKHIQLHPSLKTADSHFSATPSEFVDYCMAVENAWLACQPPVGDAEKDSRQFRRAPGGKRGSYHPEPLVNRAVDAARAIPVKWDGRECR